MRAANFLQSRPGEVVQHYFCCIPLVEVVREAIQVQAEGVYFLTERVAKTLQSSSTMGTRSRLQMPMY